MLSDKWKKITIQIVIVQIADYLLITKGVRGRWTRLSVFYVVYLKLLFSADSSRLYWWFYLVIDYSNFSNTKRSYLRSYTNKKVTVKTVISVTVSNQTFWINNKSLMRCAFTWHRPTEPMVTNIVRRNR